MKTSTHEPRSHLLDFFPNEPFARDVWKQTNCLLANVDLFLREKLSAKLRKDKAYLRMPIVIDEALAWLNDLNALMEGGERHKYELEPIDCLRVTDRERESLAAALRAPEHIRYQSCEIEESVLFRENDLGDEEDCEDEYEDAVDVFDSYGFPKISAADFKRFCVPQKKIPTAWRKDKAFLKLVEWLPQDSRYETPLFMSPRFAEKKRAFRNSLDKFFSLGTRYLKAAGKREACEDLLRVFGDYQWTWDDYSDGALDAETAVKMADGLARAAIEISLADQYAAVGDFVRKDAEPEA